LVNFFLVGYGIPLLRDHGDGASELASGAVMTESARSRDGNQRSEIGGSDNEIVALESDGKELVEAFGKGGRFEDFVCAVDAGDGDFLFAGAAGVAFEGSFNIGNKEVTYDAEAGGFGGVEVRLTGGGGGIGVVDDEVAARGEAGFNQAFFARARPREVHADAEVRGSESPEIKGAFTGALKANEDDGLHGNDQCPALMTRKDPVIKSTKSGLP
jgi:hypothetical protein